MKAKIYCIKSEQTNMIYIGSTTEKYLSKRFGHHKADFRRWKLGKQHYISSFELLKYDDCYIELIENLLANF